MVQNIRRMSRRTFSAAAAGLAAAGMLAACATGGTAAGTRQAPSSAGSAFASPPQGEITVWAWDVAATALKRLAGDFEKKHPGTTITVTDIGYDNAYDKISVGLQSGSGLPDLVSIETDHMPGYIAQFPTALYDVSAVSGIRAADFDASKIAASTGPDGALRSVPWDSGTVALYVRTDELQAAGVEPSALATWDDTITAGEKIKAATGHTLMSIDVSSGATFLMLMQQQGAGIFDDRGKITVNGPAGVRALTFLKTLHDKGLLDNVKGWDGRVTATKAGKSAIHPEAVWWTGTLTSEMKELSGRFSVLPLPTFTGAEARTANNGGSTLAIPTQAKNPSLAGAFTAYVLADRANQVSMMKNEGLFPSYLPALKDPWFAQEQPYFGGEKVFAKFATLTSTIPPISYTKDYAKATDLVAGAVVQAVLGGKDPKAALDGAARQIADATGRAVAG